MALPIVPELDGHDTGAPADLVDWYAYVGDDPVVIYTKTGRLQATLKYVCPDVEQMHPGARASYLSRLHGILGTLGAGWAADWDWWHEPANPYPQSVWENTTHWFVDELRRVSYEEEPRYESAAYLTLSWAPQQRRHKWLNGLFLTNGHVKRFQRQMAQEVQAFQIGMKRFTSLLQELMTVESLTYAQACTYLHRCVSWNRHELCVPGVPIGLDAQLTGTAFRPGQPPRLGKKWIQPCWVANWGEEMGTWLPVALEKLPFPCRLHVRWEAMGSRAAAKFLRSEEKQWAQSYSNMIKKVKDVEGTEKQAEVQGRDDNPEAIDAGESLLAVRKEVMRGQEALGILTPTLLTWADDRATLAEQAAGLTTVAFSQGLVLQEETAGASLGWIASIPGNVAVGIRGLPLRTQELSALMPHTAVWGGPSRDAHLNGPPVLLASTDGTPFRLVTHVGELGHMLVAGPSRAGKSGFLGLLARQWFRYPRARVCMFDRDYALKAVTLLSGGVHYELGSPGSPGLQPLARIDEKEERIWAWHWLESLLKGEGLAPTPEEREEIWAMLQRVASMPSEQRTMTMARQQLQVQRLKVGLAPFCQGGVYAFFDAKEDALGLSTTRLMCFEMRHVLTMPRASEAGMAYIFRRLETDWFDGSPVLVEVDEGKWLLAIETFVGEFEVWLKARAKKNVAIVLSTQELIDIHRTSAWQAVLASVPTKIFLPNHAAMSPDVAEFYRSVGLSESELQLLVSAQPLRDYLYRSPLGTRLFQLHLSPLERLLCAASTLEELEVLSTMQGQYLPDTLVSAWLRHWGYAEEAAFLEKVEQRHDVDTSRRNGHDAERVGVRGL